MVARDRALLWVLFDTGITVTELCALRVADVDQQTGLLRVRGKGGKERLLSLGITDRRFGWPLEMVTRAADGGWRIAEVDVDYAPRAEGTQSKVTGTVRGTVRTVLDMRAVLAR